MTRQRPDTAQPSAPVTLRIEHLRLVGFSRRAALHIRDSLSETLTRLIQSDPRLGERLRARTEQRLSLPVLPHPRSGTPRQFGERLARALLKELSR
jgi:hypothetical protein